MPGIGLAPGGPMAVKDVCDLQSRAAHRRRTTLRVGLLTGQRCEPVERAGYFADRGVGDARVKGRGVELGMAEQHLDDADIGVLFQQVRGEAVPQRVRRHSLFELAGRERPAFPLGGGTDMRGPQKLARNERDQWVHPASSYESEANCGLHRRRRPDKASEQSISINASNLVLAAGLVRRRPNGISAPEPSYGRGDHG
jgi:hypothetical protein